MNRASLTSILISIFLATCAIPAFGINVCTDSNGRTHYQDRPCPPLPTNTENQIQPTGPLTPRIAADTIQRFHQAMSERDIRAAAGYLGRHFTATIENQKGVSQYNRGKFANMLSEVLSAASEYHSTAICGNPSEDQGAFVLQCEVQEQMILLRKAHGGSSTETYRVVLEDGYAKLSEIRSKQHQGDFGK